MSGPTSLTLAGGRLAALSWGEPGASTWLALHGWLDNAASFSRLAPLLVERLSIRVVAIDFSGHGLSRHGPPGCDYAIWDYLHDVLDALESLSLERATFLAHSMGAGVSCLLAAALPERVERLVLIDGLGTLTTPAEETAAQLRKGIIGHRRHMSGAPRYPDIETAIAARIAGGVTPLNAVTAEPLVVRNVEHLADGHVRLRTDSRLLRPSLVRFCPQQVFGVLATIRSPVLLIEGEAGVLTTRETAGQARRAVVDLERHVLPGGHHLHLDPCTVPAVADVICARGQTSAR